MGGGVKSQRNSNFNLHFPYIHQRHHNHNNGGGGGGGKKQSVKVRDVPKGCLAIKVGRQEEKQQRFVVPIIYFNHPLFIQLLKEAEDEYGFDHRGTITIPCHVEEFRYVQGIIDQQNSLHHHVGCFLV